MLEKLNIAFSKSLVTDGKSTRSEFWIFTIFSTVVGSFYEYLPNLLALVEGDFKKGIEFLSVVINLFLIISILQKFGKGYNKSHLYIKNRFIWGIGILFSVVLHFFENNSSSFFNLGYALIEGVLFVLAIACMTRRLHDTNRSGYLQFWALTGVGLIPLLYFSFQKSRDTNGKYEFDFSYLNESEDLSGYA